MNRVLLLTPIVAIAVANTACGDRARLPAPWDVSGNFDVTYTDTLRIYIGDELVAEGRAGDSEEITWNGQTFDFSSVCGDESTLCPGEAYWAEIGIDQPWGEDYRLINIINLDGETGTPGQRLGGTVAGGGALNVLSGLALGANQACVAVGVGTITGRFDAAAEAVDEGVLAFEWGAGCQLGSLTVGGTLRVETDFTAVRVGDLDLSSVEDDLAVDEDGAPL